MKRSALSASIICTMLVLALFIIGLATGDSSHKTKAISQSEITQLPAQIPDPPGTIDGEKNPELIPDHVAYSLIFRTIATPNKTEFEIQRSRAWASRFGFTDEQADKLIEADE